jgi:hypothetical protein
MSALDHPAAIDAADVELYRAASHRLRSPLDAKPRCMWETQGGPRDAVA